MASSLSYPQYPSYLDFIYFATKPVSTPPAAPVKASSIVPEQGGGDEGGPGNPGGNPTVGSAAQAATSGSMLGPNTMSNLATVNSALALLGMPSVPSPATALFGAANKASAALSALNVDPVFAMPVAQALADPIASQFVNPAAAAVSPLSMATIPAISANQSAFGLSPFSLGTPFSMPAMTARGGGEPTAPSAPTTSDSDAAAGMSGVGAVSDSGGGPVGDGGSSSPSAYHTGGVVRNRTRGSLEERITAQQGEYVVRRSSAVKYRDLLDAINRDRPVDVKRLAGKLRTRMVA